MNLADALSGSAGLEGIRWMLRGAPHRALRRKLAALLTAPDMLGTCHLRRARFKPGRNLMAYYDVHIGTEGNDVHNVRPTAVTWACRGDGDLHHAAADLAEIEAEAGRRGLSAPFWKLAADAQALGMHVRVSPLDVSCPQLVRLCDPQHVRDMVASAYAASGVVPDRSPASRYSVTSIRYRPGQRHVLRYDALDAPGRGALFAKPYTCKDGVRAFRLAKQIADWLAENGEGVTSVQPLAFVPDDAVVLYPQVLGTPLSKHLRHSDQDLAGLLKATGAALYALHKLPPAIAGSLGNPKRPASFPAEVKDIARTSEHVSALLPPVGATLTAVLGRAQELYERLPLEPPTFTYGDFKGAHVWVTAGGPTFIDFDSCHLGDPALDIGKFLADLRFWCTVNGQHELKQVQEQFLAGYGPSAPAERMVRARLYEVVEFVKETVRRVRMFERGWGRRTERLIGCAQSVLSDLQRDLGVPRQVRKKTRHAHS